MQTFNRSAPSSSNVKLLLAASFTIGRGRRARSGASLPAQIEEMRSIFEIGVLTEGREARSEASLAAQIEEMRSIFEIGVLTEGREARSEASLAAQIEEMRSIFEIGVLTEGKGGQEAELLWPPESRKCGAFSRLGC